MDYERILRIDPDRDICCVWTPGDGESASPEASLSGWLETLSTGGVLYGEDQARVLDFLSPKRLRAAAREDGGHRILYRRLTSDGSFRWNLMELRREQQAGCFLRIQDVHEIIRESRELEGLDPQMLERLRKDSQVADVLRSRFQILNTVDLETGQCRRMILNAAYGRGGDVLVGDYAVFIQRALSGFVYPDDAEIYRNTLSLEHLRERASSEEDFFEESCVYRQVGKPLRWIELWVIYARKDGRMTVNILGRDATREKQREEDNRHILEERTYMITSLSSLFFSTYYIDLEQNTFRAVNQLRRVGDILGAEVDYSAGLQLYANHFIHPDDRAEYLRTMSCENLKASLRWWSPCVAVEYRRLPDVPGDGNCEWVRASAVLAHSGADSLPKTAIYAAQSISSGRRAAPAAGSSGN